VCLDAKYCTAIGFDADDSQATGDICPSKQRPWMSKQGICKAAVAGVPHQSKTHQPYIMSWNFIHLEGAAVKSFVVQMRYQMPDVLETYSQLSVSA
jgi:hypothetical protein